MYLDVDFVQVRGPAGDHGRGVDRVTCSANIDISLLLCG
jgi:hypothetical protein